MKTGLWRRAALASLTLLLVLVAVLPALAQDDVDTRPFLGVLIQNITFGAVVIEVLPDTPAEAAGLQPGDLVQFVNDEPVTEAATLPQQIIAQGQGTQVVLTVERAGETLEIEVTLGLACDPDLDQAALAEDYFAVGQYNAASIAYSCVLNASPDDLKTGLKRGVAYFLADDFASAMDDFARVNQLNEEYLDRALEEFSGAIEADADDVVARSRRAVTAFFLQDPAQAVDDLLVALEIEPERAALHNALARAYLQLEDPEAALDAFAQAIALAPLRTDYLLDRASIYLDQQDFDLALADYDAAIALSAYLPEPYLQRAIAHAVLEEFEGAISDFDRVVELRGEGTPPLVFLYRATSYEQIGQPTDAAGDYAEWLALIQTEMVDESPLEDGDSTVVDMAPGRVFSIEFEGHAGQQLNVSAAPVGGAAVDPLIVVLDPNGDPLVGNDNHVGYEAVITDFSLLVDGTYTLLVGHSIVNGDTGPVQVTLEMETVTQSL